jgi:2'-5' RNA ligase
MRLFFALWPDAAVRDAVLSVAAIHGITGRLTPRRNVHLTLVFVGAVAERDLAGVGAAGDAVVGEEFELMLDQLGHVRRRRLSWLAASRAPEALLSLHGQLLESLRHSGFKVDGRPLWPHLTLARKALPHDRVRVPPIRWSVRSFCLVGSTLSSAGASYQVLRKWPLRPDGSRVSGTGGGGT